MVSFFWGFLLPSVGVSLYFYSSPESESENAIEGPVANENIKGHVNLGAQFDSDSQFVVCEKGNHIQLPVPKEQKIVAVTDIENAESEEPVREFSWKRASNLLWKHFVTSYSDIEVVQWSLWWALAVCGALQVIIESLNSLYMECTQIIHSLFFISLNRPQSLTKSTSQQTGNANTLMPFAGKATKLINICFVLISIRSHKREKTTG